VNDSVVVADASAILALPKQEPSGNIELRELVGSTITVGLVLTELRAMYSQY
jgi:PIN domain nuclease of toxin-antitoxin system